MQRVLRILSTALMTAGIVVLLDVGLTLIWKEPLSTVYGAIQQGEAEDELAELEARFPTPADLRALEDLQLAKRLERLADRFEDEVRRGEGIGRIEIPQIDLDMVFVEGTDTASLQKGPGHYPSTAFPAQGRTVAIAGHRTTYLAPFNDIDDIQDGDEITLEMPYGTFTYTVQKSKVVEPSDVWVIEDRGYERLVLSACHPKYSAAQRYIIFAKLSDFAAAD
ncbi:MAG TPA: class E sortase [Solirubrobacterales bacterium]|nr:class E sortase [Solirubrobacterales bacterium]